MRRKSVWPKVLLALIAGALAGWTIFGVLAWRAVTVEDLSITDGQRRLDEVRATIGSRDPLLAISSNGRVARRPRSNAAPGRLERLMVLTYQPDRQRLVRADVPFWFFRLKAPAADYALRGTGLSFDSLGVTASDLEAEGPGLVLDHTTVSGSRVLIWTE